VVERKLLGGEQRRSEGILIMLGRRGVG